MCGGARLAPCFRSTREVRSLIRYGEAPEIAGLLLFETARILPAESEVSFLTANLIVCRPIPLSFGHDAELSKSAI
jgi:hypothetical protein